MAKEKSKTKSSFNKWRFAKWSLYIGTYLSPLLPASILTVSNWNKWFKLSDNKLSIGMGFVSLMISVIITIIGVAKRDSILKEKISPLFYLSLVIACWAISLMFLASIANEFGNMLLYTSFGLVGGATCDQINKSKVIKEVNFYYQTLIDNGLLIKQQKEKERREKIKAQAESEAKRRATF